MTFRYRATGRKFFITYPEFMRPFILANCIKWPLPGVLLLASHQSHLLKIVVSAKINRELRDVSRLTVACSVLCAWLVLPPSPRANHCTNLAWGIFFNPYNSSFKFREFNNFQLMAESGSKPHLSDTKTACCRITTPDCQEVIASHCCYRYDPIC